MLRISLPLLQDRLNLLLANRNLRVHWLRFLCIQLSLTSKEFERLADYVCLNNCILEQEITQNYPFEERKFCVR